MTHIFHQDCAAGGVHQLRKVCQVAKLSAPVKLDPIEAKVDCGLDVTLVVVNAIMLARVAAR